MVIEHDYLGKAARAKHDAQAAVKEKNFDLAWRNFHIQKDYYLKHATRCGFTLKQTLSLDSSVHEDMANVLRIEGRHLQAFTDILYWVIAQSGRPIKRHNTKLKAYFNRCKFKNVSFDAVEKFAQSQYENPDFFTARNKVQEWKEQEK
ncbi:MAG: hypothetical protein SVW51_11335 [Pseudomonadota bacterium]|nr:hypothetical protein [Pseudomonadota bacterium]